MKTHIKEMVTGEDVVPSNSRVGSSFGVLGGYFPEALSLVY